METKYVIVITPATEESATSGYLSDVCMLPESDNSMENDNAKFRPQTPLNHSSRTPTPNSTNADNSMDNDDARFRPRTPLINRLSRTPTPNSTNAKKRKVDD
ncbi:uncharacterized protein LOC113005726 isoform X2 [Solenopsis invicta]|uniref:uncharacterized protein LOC113005726 isoform X2 n=1 Tax=Solenopsis invicta TaxID=13686 RepID=UPI00193E8272|nr:uncharacterized protein LOC113005726 isoform X2 [Solenopsis invicta]